MVVYVLSWCWVIIHILYIIILYFIFYIILYSPNLSPIPLFLSSVLFFLLLLYSSSVLFPPPPNPLPLLPTSPSSPPLLPPSLPLLPNIHSILVGTYIYLFIFNPQEHSDPARSIGVDG
jgi:hypothetical protein